MLDSAGLVSPTEPTPAPVLDELSDPGWTDDHGPLTIPGIFIAPTEPLALRAIGKSSSLPEKFGADILWMHGGSRYGIQRKEAKDLMASVEDGRLAKEVGQMHSANVRGIVVIEGPIAWTSEGEIVTGYGGGWNRARWFGVQLGIQLEGVWVVSTPSLADTIAFIRIFNTWTKKRAHSGLGARPGPKGLWGTRADDKDWAKHILTGFPGIGPTAADRIYDQFGRAPLRWDCTKSELMQVKGLGVGKVGVIWDALNKDENDAGRTDD